MHSTHDQCSSNINKTSKMGGPGEVNKGRGFPNILKKSGFGLIFLLISDYTQRLE